MKLMISMDLKIDTERQMPFEDDFFGDFFSLTHENKHNRKLTSEFLILSLFGVFWYLPST
jgi:hypothetical protein